MKNHIEPLGFMCFSMIFGTKPLVRIRPKGAIQVLDATLLPMEPGGLEMISLHFLHVFGIFWEEFAVEIRRG